MRKQKLGATQQKILILLCGGLALSMTTSSFTYYRLVHKMHKAWKEINMNELKAKRSVKLLKKRKFIAERRNAKGEMEIYVTEAGRTVVKKHSAALITVKPHKSWDGLWRIVIFDVPEYQRTIRDLLRHSLRRLQFYELQKSVFVYPHDCFKEMRQLAAIYEAENFMHLITAKTIERDGELKKHFRI